MKLKWEEYVMKKLLSALLASAMALSLLAGCGGKTGGAPANGSNPGGSGTAASDLFPKDKDPILAEADAAQPDGEMVMYDGGGDDFTALQNETTFDYKKLGAQMHTNGYDMDATLDDLDAKWPAARANLGNQ